MIDMINLKRETYIDEKEVAWVGTDDGEYAISWEEFLKIADIEYDSGFGLAYIPTELVVVFKDGSWLERHEYDGSESWVFKSAPVREPDSVTWFRRPF